MKRPGPRGLEATSLPYLMPTYPTPSQYQEAVQLPEVAFANPDLQTATLEETPLGLPRVITGAYAAVFPLHARTRRWAVKCFLIDVPDQQQRYAAISDHLARHDLPYLVPFDYQRRGVEVHGRWWPLLKMAWAEGLPINRFVARHLDAPALLLRLADAWRTLLRTLADADLAHGDFQHGNILVHHDPEDDHLTLRLVDYDTMYVPALRGRGSPEVGHRNYQHPDRSERDFGLAVDRFSALVVYVGLRACAERSDLWARYDRGENVLFTAADFYDPASSALLADLHSIEVLRPWAEVLQRACLQEPEAVPSLDDLHDALADGVVPLASGTARRRSTSPSPTRPRGGVERAAPWIVALAAAVAASSWGLPVWWVGPAVSLLLLAGLAGALARRYRRLPSVRRQQRLQQERRYFAERLRRLAGEHQRLLDAQQQHLERAEEVRAAWLDERREQVLYDHLKHHFIGEASSFEGITHKTVVRLKAAGIRTAYQITPERLRAIHTIGETSRARVLLWRAALAQEVQAEVPETLSPAEERRVERLIEQRTEALAHEAMRVQAKIAVQREEQAQVEARGASATPVTPGLYLRYVLGWANLPARTEAPSPPSPVPPSPVPASAPAPDAPWWATPNTPSDPHSTE